MIRFVIINLFSIVLLVLPAYARTDVNYSSIGVVQYDYFDHNPDSEERSVRVKMELETNHLHKGVWENLAAGRFQPVLYDLNFILDRMPNHPKALMLVESIARTTENPSLPISYYERAVRSYPQHALTHAQYGAYLVSIGSTEKGIAKLKRAIEIDPKLALSYAWLSKAYYKNGNSELGRQAAEQARTLGYRSNMTGQRLER